MRLRRLKPKLIAVDLLLVDRGTADGDAALAKSFATRPPVLAAAAIFSETSQTVTAGSDGPLGRLPKADRFLQPLKLFADHAEVGIANVATTESGTPYAVPMLFRTQDKVELSLALRVAAIAIGKPLTIEPNQLKFGDYSVSTDSDYTLPITYYGPRRTIRTVSAASAIDGDLDRDIIADRIVILGATVSEGGDFFPTPFDSRMPGVEVLATAMTHLVAGDGILRDRSVRLIDASVAIVLPVVLVALLGWQRSAIGLGDHDGGRRGMGDRKLFRIHAWHVARRRDDHRSGRAPRPGIRRGAIMVGATNRTVFSPEKPAARTIPVAGRQGMALPGSQLPDRADEAGRRRRLR